MLEPEARSGPARRLIWRRGDVAVRTPLLFTRARSLPQTLQGSSMGVLVAPGEAVPDAVQGPVIRLGGGFLQGEAVAPEPAAWAELTTATAQVVQSRLAMLHRPVPAPALPEFASPRPEPGDPDDLGVDAQAPGTALDAVGTASFGENVPPGAGDQARAFVVSAGEEVGVAPGLAGLAGDPERLAVGLVRARTEAGAGRLLLAPGVGFVHHAALLVYAGVDLLDTLAVERASLAGRYLTSEGVFEAARLRAPLCGCPVCRDAAPSEMSKQDLWMHNLQAFVEEHARVVGHLCNDTLRELVEQRARAHPATAAVLRRLDRDHAHFAARWPLHSEARVHATVSESLTRPDVARYRARLRDSYAPPGPADVLVLLPCSATKPYARSPSHRVFRRVISELGAASRVHEVMVTSPLGVVPRELELTWPAAQYDVPVTGHWDREERQMIRHQLRALLDKNSFSKVVSHLDASTHELVADLLPQDAPHTGTPRPTSIPARDRLRRELQIATRGTRAPTWPERRRGDAHALLAWQVGSVAAGVLREATRDVSGRPPGMRIYAQRGNREPLATLVPKRGLFAFTLRAARLLHENGCARTVRIDDFMPRGTLFAVGVQDADPAIVPGDEVVLVHGDEVRGVGRAVMTGEEMTAFPRGPAVEVRHHA